jgi:hypothetical protein
MTTQRAVLALRLRMPDGGYTQVWRRPGVTIGWGLGEGVHFSNDHPVGHPAYRPLNRGWRKLRRALPPLDLMLPKSVPAIGVQLFLEGHGWYAAQGLVCYGEYERSDLLEDVDDYIVDAKARRVYRYQ